MKSADFYLLHTNSHHRRYRCHRVNDRHPLLVWDCAIWIYVPLPIELKKTK